MTMTWTRRSALAGLTAALGSATLRGARAAQRVPSLEWTPLSDDLAVVSGGGANFVVARSGSDLLLVDGGSDAAAPAVRRLLAQRYPDSRVTLLLNTHWHWDQTGYNATAAAAGATLIAHENTRLWLGIEVDCAWEGRRYAPRPVKSRPNQTLFYGSNTVEFGGQKVEYGYLPQAHTDGDLYVHFPREDVLVVGDVAGGRRYPVVDPCSNGWLGGMAQAVRTLAGRCQPGTRVIAGQGPVLGAADLKAQQDLCFEVLSRIGQSYYRGETRAEFLASAPTREFDATFGDPARFLATSYDSAWNHVNEIRRIAR